MSRTVIEDPTLHETKNVDSNGRIYLGKSYAGAEAEVVIKILGTSTSLDKGLDRSEPSPEQSGGSELTDTENDTDSSEDLNTNSEADE